MTDDTVERMAIAIKAAVDLEGDKPLHEQVDVSTDKGSLEFSRTIARAALSAMPQQEVTVKDAIRWLKLIRDQDQGCGGRLNPQEIYLAMQREANNALSALSGQDAEGEA